MYIYIHIDYIHQVPKAHESSPEAPVGVPKTHVIHGVGALIPYWHSDWTLWVRGPQPLPDSGHPKLIQSI